MGCAGSLHTAHVAVARDGNVEGDDGASYFVKEDVKALIVTTGGDFHCCHDDLLGDVIDPVSTKLTVLICQLRLPNWFALAF